MTKNWQLEIFRKSLKKRQRVRRLATYTTDLQGKKCLELGCARGIIGYHLREFGGNWIHLDTDLINLQAAKELLPGTVVRSDPYKVPFPDGVFDCVAALDILEHLEEDFRCLDEIFRILKPGGFLILSTPADGPFYLVNKIKNYVGLTPDIYGHVREGYRPAELVQKLHRRSFQVEKIETFTHFFTEFVEMIINLGYIYVLGNKSTTEKRDGAISPSSESELNKNRKIFRFYSLIFPITWAFSRLDLLLFFTRGYTIILKARKCLLPEKASSVE